jgi:hypothetical protein
LQIFSVSTLFHHLEFKENRTVAFASELDKEDQDYGEEWVTDCTKDEMLQVGCFPLALCGERNSVFRGLGN